MASEAPSEAPKESEEEEVQRSGREILRVEGVRKAFRKRVVLHDFNLSVCEARTSRSSGRAAPGKSVLLRIVTGLLEPDEGRVLLWGQDTTGFREEDWWPLLRRMGWFSSRARSSTQCR
jgi:ABC-type transporter Mla maintaining outer membrane lipid asymmetry ATPase subunit MlaF